VVLEAAAVVLEEVAVAPAADPVVPEEVVVPGAAAVVLEEGINKNKLTGNKQSLSYHLRYFNGSGFKPRHLNSRLPRLKNSGMQAQAAPTYLSLALSI
jgi:hypothetical protein